MGRNPTVAAGNIYCRARLEAARYNDRLGSREGAAEELGLSVSQLKDYELGITKSIPPDSILRMADLYNAPELANHYCRHECPLGECVPELETDKGLDRITVRTLASLRAAWETERPLLGILADGTISEGEEPELRKILAVLKELSASAKSLEAWLDKETRRKEAGK